MHKISKMTKKMIGLVICFTVLVIFAGFSVNENKFNETSTYHVDLKHMDSQAQKIAKVKTVTHKAAKMEVHFIDVGQGDAILVKADGHNMLIDAGGNDDEKDIVAYLKGQQIKKLDYVIATHPHEDHIGGLDKVIGSFSIKTFLMPEKENTTKTFEDVLDALIKKNMSVTAPVTGKKYTLGNASFTIIAPNGTYGDTLNNWSIGIKLINGSNSFILCGDAETEAEQDILEGEIDLKADVLKISHHGSNSATNAEFLDAIDPEYAVVSCGEDNKYGHPAKDTLQKVKDRDIALFRTDKQGTVIAKSDGTKIKWSCKPTDDFTEGAGEQAEKVKSDTQSETTETNSEQAEEAPTVAAEEIAPVIVQEAAPTVVQETPPAVTDNSGLEVHITNTGSKYHSAGCQYLSKSDIITTLGQAKALGLEPCSKCNPPR